MSKSMMIADARHLPLPDRTFDLIVTSPPWDDLDVFWQARDELRRVCRKSGRMVFVLPHLSNREQASLVFTDREWALQESFAIPRPSRRLGPRYFSLDDALVVAILKRHPRARRVLDPFCGVGTVVRVVRKMGREAVGCDVDPAALAVAA